MILSFFGPSEYHSHSSNEYEITSTGDGRKRRVAKNDDSNLNAKEMVSFIQTSDNADEDDKVPKDSN